MPPPRFVRLREAAPRLFYGRSIRRSEKSKFVGPAGPASGSFLVEWFARLSAEAVSSYRGPPIMAERPFASAVRQLLRRLAPQGGKSDGRLLTRFVQSGDEEAFAALLERHGPMVWRTCRRIARQPADAEDAFQATFLVLCRKAGAIGRREALAGWLHRVASRIAVKANARGVFRPLEEAQLLASDNDPSATAVQS